MVSMSNNLFHSPSNEGRGRQQGRRAQETREQEYIEQWVWRNLLTLTFRGYVLACVRCSFIVTSFQGFG